MTVKNWLSTCRCNGLWGDVQTSQHTYAICTWAHGKRAPYEQHNTCPTHHEFALANLITQSKTEHNMTMLVSIGFGVHTTDWRGGRRDRKPSFHHGCSIGPQSII